MSKLAAKAKASKLNQAPVTSSGENAAKPQALIKKYSFHPRSYRFDEEVINILKSTLDRVNNMSVKKVSEAKLIKALIVLSRDMDEMKIIKASKEVW